MKYIINSVNSAGRKLVFETLIDNGLRYGNDKEVVSAKELNNIFSESYFVHWEKNIFFGSRNRYEEYILLTFEEFLSLKWSKKTEIVQLNEHYRAELNKDSINIIGKGSFSCPIGVIDELDKARKKEVNRDFCIHCPTLIALQAVYDTLRPLGYSIHGDKEQSAEFYWNTCSNYNYIYVSKNKEISGNREKQETITFEEFFALFSVNKTVNKTVKLTDTYSAEVSDVVKVGCQTFPITVIDKLVAAKKKVLN